MRTSEPADHLFDGKRQHSLVRMRHADGLAAIDLERDLGGPTGEQLGEEGTTAARSGFDPLCDVPQRRYPASSAKSWNDRSPEPSPTSAGGVRVSPLASG